MLSKRYKSTLVDCKIGYIPWSTSSDTQEVVEIQKETSTQM